MTAEVPPVRMNFAAAAMALLHTPLSPMFTRWPLVVVGAEPSKVTRQGAASFVQNTCVVSA